MSAPSPLSGMTMGQLQAALTSAQAAYVELMTGAKVATAAYTQGDGSKSIAYMQADIGRLNQFIAQLQIALGMRPRRRAISFRF